MRASARGRTLSSSPMGRTASKAGSADFPLRQTPVTEAPRALRRRAVWAQEHEEHHEDVLRDGGAVGAGAVGEQAVGAGPQGAVQEVVHPGGGGAEPPEGLRLREQGRRDVAEEDLVLADLRRETVLVLVAVVVGGGEARLSGHGVDCFLVMRIHKIRVYPNLSHKRVPFHQIQEQSEALRAKVFLFASFSFFKKKRKVTPARSRPAGGTAPPPGARYPEVRR